MTDLLHRRLGAGLWRTLLVLVVLLAVYVTGTRALLATLPRHTEWVAQQLSGQLQAGITLNGLAGHLEGFSPVFDVTGLAVVDSQAMADAFRVEAAMLKLDLWASLLALAPRFDSMTLQGPSLRLLIDDEMFAPRSRTGQQLTEIEALLRAFRQVSVTDGQVSLIHRIDDRREQALQLTAQVELLRAGSQRQIRARLRDGKGLVVTLAGEGIGNPFDPRASRGELHGTLRADDLAPLAALMDWSVTGGGRVDFWYQPLDGRPEWQLDATLNDLDVKLDGQSFVVTQASGVAEIRGDDDGWRAWLSDLSVDVSQAALRIPRAQLQRDGEETQFLIEHVAAGPLLKVLRESGVIRHRAAEVLETLAPTGTVEGLQVMLKQDAGLDGGWQLLAQVADATTGPFQGVPGLRGVDTYIEAEPGHARAWIDTGEFGLDLPRVYDREITLERLMGRLDLRWQSDILYLEDGVLRGDLPEQAVAIQFGMDIPLRETAPAQLQMYLTVGLETADVALREAYLPVTMNERLYRWLDESLPHGRVERASFVWRGTLSSWDSPQQTMQLALGLRDAELRFHPDWPAVNDLTGTVLVDDSRISVWAPDARMLSVAARDTSVELDAGRDGGVLRVATALDAGVDGVLDLLRRSPIETRASDFLADVSGSGRLRADLRLGMDLNRIEETLTVDLSSQLSDASLRSEALRLQLEQIAGPLNYQQGAGFSSSGLSASLWGAPLALVIGEESGGSTPGAIFRGRFRASPDVAAFVDWLESPVPPPIDGVMPLQLDVTVAARTEVSIRSDLIGTRVSLPAPMGKTAAMSTPLRIDLALEADAPVNVFWAGRLNAQLYRRQGAISGGSFDVTPRAVPQLPPEPGISGGFYVMGNLDRLEVEQWLGALQPWFDRVDVSAGGAPLTIESLNVSTVAFGETELGAMRLDLTPFADWEMLGINADWLDAELTLRHDDVTAALIVNRLDLDRLPSFSGGEGEALASSEQSPTAAAALLVTPPRLPAPLDVVIADMLYHGKPLGAATFRVVSDGSTFEIDGLRGRLANLFFEEGSGLRWQVAAGEQRTELAIRSRLGDLGDTLDQLDSPRILETERGALTADLSWSDSPLTPRRAAISGDIDLSLRDGAFLPVSNQATGLLRILTLLNLSGLVRQANVNQLFDPGVAFATADGKLSLGDGRLLIPGFEIQGSGGRFLLDADIDLVAETIDGELVVTLPLASNIPWVAALAGGVPIAAGAYILSRVFEDQVNSLSSGVYSVNGELGNPSVKFERIFDAQSKAAKTRQQATTGQGEP